MSGELRDRIEFRDRVYSVFWTCVAVAALVVFVFASASDSAGSSSYDFREELRPVDG